MKVRAIAGGFKGIPFLAFSLVLNSCQIHQVAAGPSIEFTKVPPAAQGGRERVDTISGLEERLAERTRIAQDLHDTLLQGVLSASMQLHVGVDQLPDDSPARATLNRVLQLMGQVVEEGRNTLRGRRTSIESPTDLTRAFSRVPQELGKQEGIDFRVIVEGQSLPVRSVIRDDVYSIGREALVNALRHSQATNIEVELDYSPTLFSLAVRDNGCGIDPEMIESGREGHWGLSGMRERAERIRASVKVMSRPKSGTEVALRVPRDVAFEFQVSGSAVKMVPGSEAEACRKSRPGRQRTSGINERSSANSCL